MYLINASMTPVLLTLMVWSMGCETAPNAGSDLSMIDTNIVDDQSIEQDGTLLDAGGGHSADAGIELGPCEETQWSQVGQDIRLVCGAGELVLTPQVHLEGEWRMPDGCEASGPTEMRCDYTQGQLVVGWAEGVLNGVFTTTGETSFGGIQYFGRAVLPSADAWLSNGFQSWSQTGVIKIPQSVGRGERSAAFAARSDAEVIRNGTANSWWHTFVRAEPSLVAGVTSAKTFRSWIGVTGTSPDLEILLSNGGTGESLDLAVGDVIDGEAWVLMLTNDINEGLSQYAEKLPRRGRVGLVRRLDGIPGTNCGTPWMKKRFAQMLLSQPSIYTEWSPRFTIPYGL